MPQIVVLYSYIIYSYIKNCQGVHTKKQSPLLVRPQTLHGRRNGAQRFIYLVHGRLAPMTGPFCIYYLNTHKTRL